VRGRADAVAAQSRRSRGAAGPAAVRGAGRAGL